MRDVAVYRDKGLTFANNDADKEEVLCEKEKFCTVKRKSRQKNIIKQRDSLSRVELMISPMRLLIGLLLGKLVLVKFLNI